LKLEAGRITIISIRGIMTFNEYQESARSLAIYPGQGDWPGLIYTILGLSGETGECCEKLKKIYRDTNKPLSPRKHSMPPGDFRREELLKELGDVLWYVANVASELDTTLEEIANTNLDKLNSRKDRNKLHGDGDNR
jgi:NTP pyrophosphatase (non-canonical NTP hydrolase)